jgi:hypothetical protein
MLLTLILQQEYPLRTLRRMQNMTQSSLLTLPKQTLQVNVSSSRERTNLSFLEKGPVLGTRLIGISVITTMANKIKKANF